MKFKFTAQTNSGTTIIEVEGDSLQDVYSKIDNLGYEYDGVITLIEDEV